MAAYYGRLLWPETRVRRIHWEISWLPSQQKMFLDPTVSPYKGGWDQPSVYSNNQICLPLNRASHLIESCLQLICQELPYPQIEQPFQEKYPEYPDCPIEQYLNDFPTVHQRTFEKLTYPPISLT